MGIGFWGGALNGGGVICGLEGDIELDFEGTRLAVVGDEHVERKSLGVLKTAGERLKTRLVVEMMIMGYNVPVKGILDV